jgi:hypothetical protein
MTTATFTDLEAEAAKASAEAARLAAKVAEMINRRETAASEAELAFWREAERVEIPALRRASADAHAAFAAAATDDTATLNDLMALHVAAERMEQLMRSGAAEIWFRLDILSPLPHSGAQGQRSRTPALWLHREPVPFSAALDAAAQARMAAIKDEPAADRRRRLETALAEARAKADQEAA